MKGWSIEAGGRAAVLFPLLLLMLTTTPTSADDSREDDLSSVLREVTGQLERFNSLYINKLERELSANSARMAALEVMVRGLADRAPVWDNIQNHMAVWTDQSRTMERKMDILNRCHESQASWEDRLSAVDALNHKLTALDNKINAMSRLEFKVEQVSERVEEVDSTVKWVQKRMGAPDHPVLTEFAGRGVLSSLLTIENQLTNISRRIPEETADQGVFSAFHRTNVYGVRGQATASPVAPEPGLPASPTGNIPITTTTTSTHFQDLQGSAEMPCVLQPMDSRRLQDISAKVDLVFDHLVVPDYDYDHHGSQIQQRAVPVDAAPSYQEENEESTPELLFTKFWKSLFSPIKTLRRRFNGFETQLTSVRRSCNESAFHVREAAATGREWEPLAQDVRQMAQDSREAMADHTTSLNKVAQSTSQATRMTDQVLTEMRRGFQALESVIRESSTTIKDLISQYCSSSHQQPPTPQPPTFPSTTGDSGNGDNDSGDSGQKEKYNGFDGIVRTSGVGIRDCSDMLAEGHTRSDVYSFTRSSLRRSSYGHDYYRRYCDQQTSGGGWTVLQRRGRGGPPFFNFTQNWYAYKDGFGDLTRDFWWGNDNLHRLTSEQRMMIRFDLWDFEGNYAYAEYLTFSVGPETDNYRLRVYDYQGNASDSFSAHNDFLFSTYDRDNDKAPDCCPCAVGYGGGWWFYSCFESNLNGVYYTNPRGHNYRGIIWEKWLDAYSLRATEIKVRPASFSFSTDDNRDNDEPALPQPTMYPPLPYPTVPELPLRQH